jgi:hypothetical protein
VSGRSSANNRFVYQKQGRLLVIDSRRKTGAFSRKRSAVSDQFYYKKQGQLLVIQLRRKTGAFSWKRLRSFREVLILEVF